MSFTAKHLVETIKNAKGFDKLMQKVSKKAAETVQIVHKFNF